MRWFAVRPKVGITLQQLKTAVTGVSSGIKRINEESDHLNILLQEGVDADVVIRMVETLPGVQSVLEDTTPVPLMI